MAALAGLGPVQADDAAANVIILANSDDPDSLQLARYYAQKRAVPAENILAFRMPRSETISRAEFVTSIWQPVEEELIRRDWIHATASTLIDEMGRRKYATYGHRISYLVVCRGVPLRVADEPALALIKEEPVVTLQPNLRTNQAAVDSELALLAQSRPPINGPAANPLFRREHPGSFEEGQVVRVSRLDGPDFESARALVDHAIAAERTGLLGRAYVDLNGIHPTGDEWLEAAAAQLATLGFDRDEERTPATFPVTARMDAPVLYFGWYAGNLNGPFALPGFRFPPGAVALHIHSYSAATLNSATEGWTGPLVARGVTATVGNVFEPYLQFTHEPQLLLRALARGESFGAAAAYSLPAFSWQCIAIGDPLYRPFAVSLEKQLANFAQLPADLAAYAALRQAHLLETAGKAGAALALLRREAREHPGLPVAVALAARLESTGDATGAAQALTVAALLTKFQPDEWALVRLAAHRLAEDGAAGKALLVYQHLLADGAVPPVMRAAWLDEARQAAVAAGDPAQAAQWGNEIERVSPPPEKK
ncbi:MAG: TIGR03790 family protein [Pseudomonadota bacterium]